VARYGDDSFIVASGLAKGEIVVTGGVQKLVPGEKVRLMTASAGQ
jgi:formylmethanofuran dehydrogenase subunit C